MKNLDSNDPKRLDGLTPQQILEEIRQISTQYLKEVPSNGRVAWPESIRARILALARLGVPRKKNCGVDSSSRSHDFSMVQRDAWDSLSWPSCYR
jgi:hypothetical protein